MQEPQLTLIDERSEAGRPDGRGPLWIALTLLATAALATIFGADIARQTVDTREQAEKIGRLSLTEGSRSPATQAALREFRETLVERPLDSRRRAQYGALLLDLGRDATDARAAAFHARQAVALAPVTVPTLRIAARTLVRTGDRDTSVTLVRRMFQFDAPAAARLLLEIEPWLYAGELDDALPDDPEAWLAWYGRLRREGRSKSSLPVMAQLRRRWPDFLAARVAEALQVNRAGDDLTLRRLLPADERLPETRAAAPLHALRGRIEATLGDPIAARRDLQSADRLDGDSLFVLRIRGDGLLALDDRDGARDAWLGALFGHPDALPNRRVEILKRLAQLEEREGRSGVALRHWRSIRSLDPEDRESATALKRLTGASE